MGVQDNIANALGIETTPKQEIEIIPPEKKKEVSSKEASQDDEDFEFVRDTIKNLIEKGSYKLDEMGSLASDLENARGFEVYGSLLEKVQGLAMDLYELHKKKKDLKEEAPINSDVTIEKAVFVGTQSELLDAIKKNGNTSQED